MLVLASVLLVVSGAAGLAWYLLAGSSDEQDHRSQVWGAIMEIVALSVPA